MEILTGVKIEFQQSFNLQFRDSKAEHFFICEMAFKILFWEPSVHLVVAYNGGSVCIPVVGGFQFSIHSICYSSVRCMASKDFSQTVSLLS